MKKIFNFREKKLRQKILNDKKLFYFFMFFNIFYNKNNKKIFLIYFTIAQLHIFYYLFI